MAGVKEEERIKSVGSRGKVAEKKVREYLEKLAASCAGFDFERRYDARSAGGKGIPAQAGDFGFFRLLEMGSVNGLAEVKEVASNARLPQKNMQKDSIARLKKRYLAGTDIVVLVYHTGLKKWRNVPFEVFSKNPAAPSWDLSAYPLYATVAGALEGVEALSPAKSACARV